MVRVQLTRDVGNWDKGSRYDEKAIPVAKMLELIADGDAVKAPPKPNKPDWNDFNNVSVKLLVDVDNKGKAGQVAIYPIKTTADINNVVNLQKQKILQILNLSP